MRLLGAVLVAALAGCGGAIETSTDSGANDAASSPPDAAPDVSSLAACAHACVLPTGGGGGECPVLLTYDCLRVPCGDPAATAICEAATGAPASIATIKCVQAAFPSCPVGVCQGSTVCKTFIACIEGCH